MKIILAVMLSLNVFAQNFNWGKGESEFGWGISSKDLKEKSDMQLKLGFRLQSALQYSNSKNEATDTNETLADLYGRRVRFQFEAKFPKDIKFYMDIRNDRVNYEDDGDGEFTVGDAFIEHKNFLDKSWLTLVAFRSKVDVSRTQTISSSRLLFHDRPYVADFAAEYVSAGRRANNIQLRFNPNKKLSASVALGDGVQSSRMKDAKDKSADAIERQNFMIGGKVKYSPFEGWEEGALTENYFGQGKHFTVGLGKFMTNGIEFKKSSNVNETDHDLTNMELSMHYYNLAIQAEYFLFDGMVEDFTAANINKGESSGYYVQGEYVFADHGFFAPMFRYESWDKFNDASDYQMTSKVLGLNYYLKGNKMKFGIYLQRDEFDKNVSGLTNAEKTDDMIKITSDIHY